MIYQKYGAGKPRTSPTGMRHFDKLSDLLRLNFHFTNLSASGSNSR
jgi:hypothetical protein